MKTIILFLLFLTIPFSAISQNISIKPTRRTMAGDTTGVRGRKKGRTTGNDAGEALQKAEEIKN